MASINKLGEEILKNKLDNLDNEKELVHLRRTNEELTNALQNLVTAVEIKLLKKKVWQDGPMLSDAYWNAVEVLDQ
jgi:hypothetical protein